MTLVCYHCGKGIRGKVQHVIPPLFVQRITGDFPKAYHPACYAKSEQEAEFALERGSQRDWQRGSFASTPTKQQPLFSGLDCLPGQADLFDTDGGPQP